MTTLITPYKYWLRNGPRNSAKYGLPCCGGVDVPPTTPAPTTTLDTEAAKLIVRVTTTTSPSLVALPMNWFIEDAYNFVVDWGDGSAEQTVDIPSQTATRHIYAVAGTYDIKIDGVFPGLMFNYDAAAALFDGIVQWGNTGINGFGLQECFVETNFNIVPADQLPNTSLLTNLRQIAGYSSEYGAPIGLLPDMSYWDTSNVTDMSYAFSYNPNVPEDILSWDLSSCRMMELMFANAVFDGTFFLDFTGWDVSKVISSANIFNWAVFNGADISLAGWNFVINSIGLQGLLTGKPGGASLHGKIDVTGMQTQNCSLVSYTFENAMATSIVGVDTWDITGASGTVSNFALGSSLTTAEYDAILIAWSVQTVNTGVVINFGTVQYSAGAAADARAVLQGKGWTISDGGQVP